MDKIIFKDNKVLIFINTYRGNKTSYKYYYK